MQIKDTNIFKSDKIPWLLVTALSILLLGSWVYFISSQHATPAPEGKKLFPSARNPAPGSRQVTDPYIAGPVKNTIRKHAQAYQSHWLAYLKHTPSITAGAIELDWLINRDGSVSEVNIIQNDFGNKAFGEGMIKTTVDIRFPPHSEAAPIYVAHKFVFRRE